MVEQSHLLLKRKYLILLFGRQLPIVFTSVFPFPPSTSDDRIENMFNCILVCNADVCTCTRPQTKGCMCAVICLQRQLWSLFIAEPMVLPKWTTHFDWTLPGCVSRPRVNLFPPSIYVRFVVICWVCFWSVHSPTIWRNFRQCSLLTFCALYFSANSHNHAHQLRSIFQCACAP